MPHLTHDCDFALMNENCISGTWPSGRTGSLAKALDTVWEIPKPLAIIEIPVDDGTIIILRRHGNPSGPRLVPCHGSGLAIDLYYPFWSLLTADFALSVDLPTLQCPAKIVGSDPVLSLSHLPRFDFSEVANVSYDFLAETTHFLQLKKPKECVVAMRDFLSFA